MSKVVGALLVLFSAAMLGIYQSSRYVNRTKQIRHLLFALQRLETEISYGLTPLPEALNNIGNRIPAPVGSFFHRAASYLLTRQTGTPEAWKQAMDEIWGKTALKGSEKEILEQLGASLGMTDREDQIKHLRLAMIQLREEEKAAREDQQRYAKMWRSLGILCGVFIVILLF